VTRAPSSPLWATGATLAEVCRGLVDHLHERWELPSIYLLVDGRLRCQASRGYFQVSDGFTPATGVIGRVVSTGRPQIIPDVTLEPAFIAAIPGLRAEVCVPVSIDGTVVGAVNLESRAELDDAALRDALDAADALGRRLEALGGLPQASLAERLAQVAGGLASQADAAAVCARAVEGARELSGMRSAALAQLLPEGWQVTCARGPLAGLMEAWDPASLAVLGGWVWAGTSSYFPDGEDVPAGYEFVGGGMRALSVQPLTVAGRVTGLLMTADTEPAVHDPALTAAMELLASQLAATLAMVATMDHLAHLATHDSLTGLHNRRALVEALEKDLRARTPSALVLLDLDGFKTVNDQHGHAEGDALLSAVARRLSSDARDGDLVCRLGGDEFAILLRDVPTAQEGVAIAERLVAAATRRPEGSRHPAVGASAGVRVLADGSASSLLVDVDAALYAAKASGRGRTVLWQPALRQDVLDQAALVADLRTALHRDELTLVYQPVVDIRTLQVRGLEALARWQHPRRGAVPPAVFVAAAERAGMVADLTRWVLKRTLEDSRSWDPGINIAVNVSAAQLTDDDVVHDVRQALLASAVPADRLVLEVTETSAVVDLERAKRTLNGLADLGVTLALDDFGTGYSSLTHAQALPFDILKIDRSFVAASAEGDRQALATIAAVCALAHRLGVDVVAEGVEQGGQLAELTGLGCGYAQGFGLARPMTAAQISRATAAIGPWLLVEPRTGRPLIRPRKKSVALPS
jgi:diguanylate cyclase (GGDEF)-like protein